MTVRCPASQLASLVSLAVFGALAISGCAININLNQSKSATQASTSAARTRNLPTVAPTQDGETSPT